MFSLFRAYGKTFGKNISIATKSVEGFSMLYLRVKINTSTRFVTGCSAIETAAVAHGSKGVFNVEA